MSVVKVFCSLVLFITLCASNSKALTDVDTIVVVDDRSYAVADFKIWWERYRDTPEQQIETIDSFIDWQLLLHEAKRMELDSLPGYQRKIEIFMNSRILMLLKNEEVDAKINLPDSLLYEHYLSEYTPARLVSLIECGSAELAERIAQIGSKQLNMQLLTEYSDQHSGSFVVHSPQWLRPQTTPVKWKSLLPTVRANGLSKSFTLDNHKVGLLFVAEEHGASDADFAAKKKNIVYELRKKKDQELTEKLLIDLRKKYNVRVDQLLLDEINLLSPDVSRLDDIVINSDKSTVTVRYFIEQCQRDQAFLQNKDRGDAKIQQAVKNQMANAMISNSLVSWEALDRHYEDVPPFKWDLQFYKEYRLVKEIENRLYSDVNISADVVSSFYQGHQEKFMQPEKVKVLILQDSKEKIFTVWTKSLVGGDPLEVAKTLGIATVTDLDNELPLTHFHPETVKMLGSLKVGEVSAPYIENGSSTLVKLYSRTKSRIEPLEKMRDGMQNMLMQQAKEKKRNDFLSNLKQTSVITVDTKRWQQLLEGD